MIFNQVAKSLPVYQKNTQQPQLNLFYFLSNVANVKTSFLHPFTLPPCAAVPGYAIQPTPS